MIRTVKICGWTTFIEKLVCIVLLAGICLIACSCMSAVQSCVSGSIDGINDVDRDSVTAGYEVLGNVGSFIAGGVTYTFGAVVMAFAFIPFIVYIITGVINIIGLVKLRQSRTGAISASAIVSISADAIILLMYLVMMIGEADLIVLMIIVLVISIFDITVNAILLYNVSKMKKSLYRM